MKFLHAADIHLDSPLAGLQARAEPLTEELRNCTRQAFSALVDLAIEEDVAFLVIAGDLYDGDWKDFSTGLFFAAEMQRLGRPCFLLRGNHDFESNITKRLKLPSNVREFSARRPETILLRDLGIALHGQSFASREVPEDLSAGYPDPIAGLLNIGVLHTSADDPGEHATYAPCTPERLRDKGYDYWALGHIHIRRVLHEGHPWIVFPGNLQGRHAKETGAKGCTLVTVEDGRIAEVAHRSLDVLRWAALEVDATEAEEAELLDRLSAVVRAALAEAEGRPLLARLTLRGETDLHPVLPDRLDELVAHAAGAAIEAGGRLWIEKVQLRTRAPARLSADALEPLRRAFLAALEDREVADPLRAELDALRQRVPAPARPDTEIPTDALGLARLGDEAWDAVVAALAAESSG
ncbi:metallophosphoesterase family protein [Falsiroseomonas oryziterrae]|uniref:metallophosphoesterase family protein n=1 Tax=Falsiroseomonas oryziterrae TaxID=2911368 RepID=UPI001F296751|nr:DNA repair exonuclease [Roseomonas sp. NPKOSM-4]